MACTRKIKSKRRFNIFFLQFSIEYFHYFQVFFLRKVLEFRDLISFKTFDSTSKLHRRLKRHIHTYFVASVFYFISALLQQKGAFYIYSYIFIQLNFTIFLTELL